MFALNLACHIDLKNILKSFNFRSHSGDAYKIIKKERNNLFDRLIDKFIATIIYGIDCFVFENGFGCISSRD